MRVTGVLCHETVYSSTKAVKYNHKASQLYIAADLIRV